MGTKKRETMHLKKSDVGVLKVDPNGELSIVESAASSSGVSSKQEKPREFAAGMEAAMVAATEECYAKGILDPEKMREYKQAAREKYKAEHKL
jgi:hypothetical protein